MLEIPNVMNARGDWSPDDAKAWRVFDGGTWLLATFRPHETRSFHPHTNDSASYPSDRDPASHRLAVVGGSRVTWREIGASTMGVAIATLGASRGIMSLLASSSGKGCEISVRRLVYHQQSHAKSRSTLQNTAYLWGVSSPEPTRQDHVSFFFHSFKQLSFSSQYIPNFLYLLTIQRKFIYLVEGNGIVTFDIFNYWIERVNVKDVSNYAANGISHEDWQKLYVSLHWVVKHQVRGTSWKGGRRSPYFYLGLTTWRDVMWLDHLGCPEGAVSHRHRVGGITAGSPISQGPVYI